MLPVAGDANARYGNAGMECGGHITILNESGTKIADIRRGNNQGHGQIRKIRIVQKLPDVGFQPIASKQTPANVDHVIKKSAKMHPFAKLADMIGQLVGIVTFRPECPYDGPNAGTGNRIKLQPHFFQNL